MTKIIDTFLFFQELDLLEIRLAYLDPFVDCFVIVEACQTFSGKPKKFVFEENVGRFSKYADKIVYKQIYDFHENFESVCKFLSSGDSAAHKKILDILQNHSHYPKTELHWVLDSYHRECIHFVTDKIAEDDDIIILSDLDEIPSQDFFDTTNLHSIVQQPRVCQQKEFRYFLNYYKDSNWLGSIGGLQKVLKNCSFNLLRMDSKVERNIVQKAAFDPGGYHFTSCGSIDMIRAKIESWAHQEFNSRMVINNLEKNIKSGQDIFQREHGTELTQVDFRDQHYFDKAMSEVLIQFPHMLSNAEIEVVQRSVLGNSVRYLKITLHKIIYKATRLLKAGLYW